MNQKQWLVDVIVVPRAKETKVTYISYDENLIRVRVVEVPENNKANRSVVRLLAEYFSIRQNEIILVSGSSSKYKKFSLPWCLKMHQKIKSSSLKDKKIQQQGYLFNMDK